LRHLGGVPQHGEAGSHSLGGVPQHGEAGSHSSPRWGASTRRGRQSLAQARSARDRNIHPTHHHTRKQKMTLAHTVHADGYLSTCAVGSREPAHVHSRASSVTRGKDVFNAVPQPVVEHLECPPTSVARPGCPVDHAHLRAVAPRRDLLISRIRVSTMTTQSTIYSATLHCHSHLGTGVMTSTSVHVTPPPPTHTQTHTNNSDVLLEKHNRPHSTDLWLKQASKSGVCRRGANWCSWRTRRIPDELRCPEHVNPNGCELSNPHGPYR
jgi:hypothetical protein